MIGLTKASLYSLGNTPDDSDPLIMLVIIGNSSAQHCFKRVVGMGSRSHDLFEVDRISFMTSLVVMGWNEANLSPWCLCLVGGGMDESTTIFALMS